MDFRNSGLRHSSAACAVALGLALTLSACGGQGDDSAPAPNDGRVQTTSGLLTGNAADSSGIVSFKGIPFAVPPVGPLRWKEPQALSTPAIARTTTAFGSQCWAASAFGGPIPTENKSEDCLFLNIWSSAKKDGPKQPVMVWLHGGGFQFGSGSDVELDGSALARKGVLVVTLNYRLGVFGFLSRPDLDQESGGHASGMYGLLDMVAALQWVKANIAAFGGDPGNVTVFGESAGAHAIGLLMASPVASGLFHKAIAQSGSFWETEMKSRSTALASGTALGTRLGAANLAALRALPAAQLQTATDWTLFVPTVFSPTVDGYVLPELPYQRFKYGRQNDVPLLLGWNADEGSPFMAYSLPHDSAQAFINAATAKFGAAHMPDFLKLYPAGSDAQATQSASQLVGDFSIKNDAWVMAGLQQQTGHSPVYVYNFNFTSSFTPVPVHTAEVAYVFGKLIPGPFHTAATSAADTALSDAMQTYWSNFVRTGNPNGTGLAAWPRYTGAGGQALLIGSTITSGPEEGTARYQFLNSNFRAADGLFTIGMH